MDAPRVGAEAAHRGRRRVQRAPRPERLPAPRHRAVGLDAVLFVAIGWLIGGLGGLRGLLPATLAAIVGGIVAFAATDLTLGSPGGGRRRAVGAGGAARRARRGDGWRPRGAGRDRRDRGARRRDRRRAGRREPRLRRAGPHRPGRRRPRLVATGARPRPGPSSGCSRSRWPLVVAVRLGSIPFHLRVPRLTDVAPPISLPLLLAWIPVPLGVAAIAISTGRSRRSRCRSKASGADRLLALVTLVGGRARGVHPDDLRHATGYLVIADAGLVLLGLRGARPGGLGPDPGLAGRDGGLEDGGRRVVGGDGGPVPTRSVPDLRGWLRHSPILGAGLAVAAVATYGLPGWVAFEARADLAELCRAAASHG